METWVPAQLHLSTPARFVRSYSCSVRSGTGRVILHAMQGMKSSSGSACHCLRMVHRSTANWWAVRSFLHKECHFLPFCLLDHWIHKNKESLKTKLNLLIFFKVMGRSIIFFLITPTSMLYIYGARQKGSQRKKGRKKSKNKGSFRK